MRYLLYVFFGFDARNFDFSAAFYASELKIHTGTQNDEIKSAARMLLFHFQNVSDSNVHTLNSEKNFNNIRFFHKYSTN